MLIPRNSRRNVARGREAEKMFAEKVFQIKAPPDMNTLVADELFKSINWHTAEYAPQQSPLVAKFAQTLAVFLNRDGNAYFLSETEQIEFGGSPMKPSETIGIASRWKSSGIAMTAHS